MSLPTETRPPRGGQRWVDFHRRRNRFSRSAKHLGCWQQRRLGEVVPDFPYSKIILSLFLDQIVMLSEAPDGKGENAAPAGPCISCYSGARNSFVAFRRMRRNGVGSSKPPHRINAPSIWRTTSSARSLAVRRERPASRPSRSRPSIQVEKVDRNWR